MKNVAMNPISICTMSYFQHKQILRHCENVMKIMGKGHTERTYHNALLIELEGCKIPYRSEVTCPFFYKGKCAGYGTADVVIFDFILELKANTNCPSLHTSQLKKYIVSLKESEKKIYDGMIVNFNQQTGKLDHVMYSHQNVLLT